MTQDAVMALARSVLISFGSILAANGYIDSGQAEAIIGGLVVIVGIAWSQWHHSGVNKADAVTAGGGEANVKAEVKAGMLR